MAQLRFRFILLLACIGLIPAIGCEKNDQVARYIAEKPPAMELRKPANHPPIDPHQTDPHQTDPTQPAPPAGEPKDRMLAAIVPLGDQGWFFKLTGPKDAVAAQGDTFKTLIQSIRFSPEGKPQWKLPEGWKELPGNDIRFATLLIPGEGKSLELTVTVLPNSGQDDQKYILMNVNRWRGQLGLPEIAPEQLAGELTQIALENTTASVVNLLGTAGPGGMGRGPFQSGGRNGN